MVKPAASTMDDPIVLDEIPLEMLEVPIIGTSPLIMHNFSEKSRRQMLEAQQGRKAIREPRDPRAEYEAAFYRIQRGDGTEGYGFPAAGFKKAIVSAARVYGKSVTQVSLRTSVFVHGERSSADAQQLVEIIGEPRMREDIVRLSGPSRSPESRFRPEFYPWSATLKVSYISSLFARSSILSLIDASGLAAGVGEWRPEKSGGEYGMYRIDPAREVQITS